MEPFFPRNSLAAAYIEEMGFKAEPYAKRVINFFVASQIHGLRLALRDRIAVIEAKKGNAVDLTTPEGRKKLWRLIAKGIYSNDKSKIENRSNSWGTGIDDPEVKVMSLYFRADNTSENCELSLGTIDNARKAVARTLTYINVMPPYNATDDLKETPRLRCRKYIYSHKHYCFPMEKHNGFSDLRRDINQHCMDEVYFRFIEFPDLVMPHTRLSELRVGVEKADWAFREWSVAWTIFKAITKGERRETEASWIWKDRASWIWQNSDTVKQEQEWSAQS